MLKKNCLVNNKKAEASRGVTHDFPAGSGADGSGGFDRAKSAQRETVDYDGEGRWASEKGHLIPLMSRRRWADNGVAFWLFTF